MMNECTCLDSITAMSYTKILVIVSLESSWEQNEISIIWNCDGKNIGEWVPGAIPCSPGASFTNMVEL